MLKHTLSVEKDVQIESLRDDQARKKAEHLLLMRNTRNGAGRACEVHCAEMQQRQLEMERSEERHHEEMKALRLTCCEQHVVTCLLEVFVEENPAATNTKVVVMDKDFTKIPAIRTTFPSSQAVQLCQ